MRADVLAVSTKRIRAVNRREAIVGGALMAFALFPLRVRLRGQRNNDRKSDFHYEMLHDM